MSKINYLIMIYLIYTTVIVYFSKENLKNRRIYYGINIFILMWELWPCLTQVPSNMVGIIYDWSPLLFLPIFYRETELLTTSLERETYDEGFIQLENQYFPHVMNIHRHNLANWTLLSEYLHLCYLSFYVLIYGVPLYFYLKQDILMFNESIFMILLLLFSCYITHGLIPVCGPRNIFEKIQDHRSQGFFFRTVHKILENGSTHGTAFPSGHTGIASIMLLMTWSAHLSLFYYILPIGIGLIISTIYGRFHYMLDVIFGLLYAFITFLITLKVYH